MRYFPIWISSIFTQALSLGGIRESLLKIDEQYDLD